MMRELMDKLAIPDANIALSANGEYYWVAVSREHLGQRYSHSVRLPLEPSDTDLENTREVFKIWWDAETKDHLES